MNAQNVQTKPNYMITSCTPNLKMKFIISIIMVVSVMDAQSSATNNNGTIASKKAATNTVKEAPFCAARGYDTSAEWIQRISLGNINNNSGRGPGYNDFTNMSTNLAKGATHSVTIIPGNQNETFFQTGYRIWIDYNRNGVFETATELVFSRLVTSLNQPQYGSIIVPAIAQNGKTRMRVIRQRGALPEPCGTFAIGEVEDYSVIITGGGSTYCATKGTDTSMEWIQGVKIGTIHNNSGRGTGYTDFTGLSTDLAKGETQAVTIVPGNQNETFFQTGYRIWIDYNRNGVFETATELVFSRLVTSLNQPQYGSIIVPATAQNGKTRMRVIRQRGALPEPCGTFDIGEVEDYSVNIVAGGLTYCAAKGNDTSFEWIQRVILGAINNESGRGTGYSDFTNLSTNLARTQTTGVTIIPGNQNDTFFQTGYRIWIDYNQNGVFETATELVFSRLVTSLSNPQSGSFTIPPTASLGKTRMRVARQRGALPEPCGTFAIGEVEDYSIVIVGNFTTAAATEQEPETGLRISSFPNPATNEVNIALNVPQQSAYTIAIIDQQGAEAYSTKGKSIENYISVTVPVAHLKKGLYLVKIKTKTDLYEQRIVVK
jgi:hypothetical protein